MSIIWVTPLEEDRNWKPRSKSLHLVTSKWRQAVGKFPEISFYYIRWSDIFVTTSKTTLSPRAEETYPNMCKVQKLEERDGVKDPGWWSFVPWATRAGLPEAPSERDAGYLFECMQQKPPRRSSKTTLPEPSKEGVKTVFFCLNQHESPWSTRCSNTAVEDVLQNTGWGTLDQSRLLHNSSFRK